MASFSIEFFSNCLRRPVQFKMIIPNDINDSWQPEQRRKGKRIKTLFLLHGYSGSAGNWVPEHLSGLYNFAIVMPNGENAFWIDGISTGHKFGSFLGVELVEYVRKTFGLAMTPEETYIMGLSMGGYGALRTALAYPETFGKTAGLSSAILVHGVNSMKPGEENGVANYEYYRECFGELSELEGSRNNPEVLVDELLAAGKKLPEIFMACGTEDFLLEPNRSFHKFLESRGVEHTYCETPGTHNMEFWTEYAAKFVPLMMED